MRYVFLLCFVFFTTFIAFNFMANQSEIDAKNKITEYKQEKEQHLQDLKDSYVSGESVTYLVTDKYETTDKTFISMSNVTTSQTPKLTLMNVKTKEVHEVETSRSFYHRTAVNMELNVTDSKDGKSFLIYETGEVFEKGNLLVDEY